MIKEILNRLVIYLARKEDIMNGFNTVGVDFDGVILAIPEDKLYQDDLSQSDPDRSIVEFMWWLREMDYKIIIFSSRVLFGKVREIEYFLNSWNIPYDLVTAIKYPCLLYVDDSAVFYKSGCEESDISRVYDILTRKTAEIYSLDLDKERNRLNAEGGNNTFSSQ